LGPFPSWFVCCKVQYSSQDAFSLPFHTDVFNNLMSQLLYSVSDSETRDIYVAACKFDSVTERNQLLSHNQQILIQGGFGDHSLYIANTAVRIRYILQSDKQL